MIDRQRRTHDAVGKGALAHMKLLCGFAALRMMQEGALATLSREKLVGTRQVYNSRLHKIPVFQSHTDGTFTYAPTVVGCSVDGINNPHIFMRKVMCIFFFAEETATRKEYAEMLA